LPQTNLPVAKATTFDIRTSSFSDNPNGIYEGGGVAPGAKCQAGRITKTANRKDVIMIGRELHGREEDAQEAKQPVFVSETLSDYRINWHMPEA
jgi:hypothetical protein